MKRIRISITVIAIIVLLFNQNIVFSKQPKRHFYYEKDYQEFWCKANNGTIEYRLPDKTRVDCVTQTHAIEFDFAKKWAESIGQSLYYGNQLNKKPGIVIISEDNEKDEKYINRIKTIAMLYHIDYWVLTPKEMVR